MDAVVHAIRDLGYDVATESRRYRVEGMHCASCVAKVEGAVSGVAGVLSATVNLATEELRVAAVSGAAGPAEIAAAVERAATSWRAKRWTRRTPRTKRCRGSGGSW